MKFEEVLKGMREGQVGILADEHYRIVKIMKVHNGEIVNQRETIEQFDSYDDTWEEDACFHSKEILSENWKVNHVVVEGKGAC